MTVSYLYSTRRQCDPSQVYLLAVPEWMQVSLKAQGLSVDQAWDFNSQSGFGSIFSDQDLTFHDEVSCLIDELLFGSHSYATDKEKFKELTDRICKAWHALPFTTDTSVNLHPVVMASNVIALINYKGDDVEEVCSTDIYERMLHCIHRLVVSQVGTRAWDSPMVRAVLERIQVA